MCIYGMHDRNAKWYRFDDDDVTAFDPENIADECFGGYVSQFYHVIDLYIHTRIHTCK